jgi:hypothetical protein
MQQGLADRYRFVNEGVASIVFAYDAANQTDPLVT